jgi:hypothetical protein
MLARFNIPISQTFEPAELSYRETLANDLPLWRLTDRYNEDAAIQLPPIDSIGWCSLHSLAMIVAETLEKRVNPVLGSDERSRLSSYE